MSISVNTDDHGVQQVIKIAGRKMTYENADVKYSVAWNFDTNVAADNRMEVEETAGRTDVTIDVLDAVNATQYVIVDAGDTVWTSFGATDVTAGSFVVDSEYIITNVGDTDFTLIGALSNTVGERFIATGTGAVGTGTAHEVIFTMVGAPGTGTGTVGAFVAESTFGA